MAFDSVHGPTGGPNLTYSLVETIGRAIVVGEYRAEAFPTEAELEKRHGVSRSVIREAVKMLSAKGLLGSRPKHGTFVLPEQEWNLFDGDILRWSVERPTSLELLLHFNELRLGIEPQAAALAAQRSTEDPLIDIDAALERTVQAEAGLDDATEADVAFHNAILLASNNPFYVQYRGIVAAALRASIRFTQRDAGYGLRLSYQSEVRDAVAEGDEDRAASAMNHLVRTGITALELGMKHTIPR
jgi:DNA-binding FadR family transcriptional regulator